MKSYQGKKEKRAEARFYTGKRKIINLLTIFILCLRKMYNFVLKMYNFAFLLLAFIIFDKLNLNLNFDYLPLVSILD